MALWGKRARGEGALSGVGSDVAFGGRGGRDARYGMYSHSVVGALEGAGCAVEGEFGDGSPLCV